LSARDRQADAPRLYETYRSAIAGRPLPLALVDLDAVDANVETVLRLLGDKPLRVATKSIRSLELTRYIARRLGDAMCGLMTYTAEETSLLGKEGFTDLLLAYPTVQKSDVEHIARRNREGAVARVVVDAHEHLDALDASGRVAGTRIPVVIEMDVALRPGILMGGVHIGVMRSPLRSVEEVVALAKEASGREHLSFAGIMGYEAQIAGVPDRDPSAPLGAESAKRAMKAVSRPQVARMRRDVRRALEGAGLAPSIFNGGGTGSLISSVGDGALTEVTVGSGFLDSHLFDAYRDIRLVPAAYFALQVVRRPQPGIVTCHGGGYIASGEAGSTRLPRVALPAGLKLTKLEGAGEVQTPLLVPESLDLAVGDPVFFRHAKAGELAEHFNEYVLVRGSRVEGTAKTYRGLGLGLLG
jgi:D-serine deaminase-like pyridoxal phosphate-dependent protein